MRRAVVIVLLLTFAGCGSSSIKAGDNVESSQASVALKFSLRPIVTLPSLESRMDAHLELATKMDTTRGLSSDMGRWDKPEVYLNGCHSSWSSAAPRPCFSGAKTGRLVVSAGDSHAAHFQPAISKWARKRGWKYASITKAGCPAVKVSPVLAEESKLRLGLAYPSCKKWQKLLVKEIKRLNPDVLILPLLSRRGIHDSGGLLAWGKAIESTLADFSFVPRVVVLGDDPKVGFDVPGCLASKKDPRLCQKPLSEAVLAERLDTERTATLRQGRAWRDITHWFCTDEVCPMVVAGIVVRRDDNHLTASFAEYLWPRFDSVIDAARGKPFDSVG